jgi:hypothetical protein
MEAPSGLAQGKLWAGRLKNRLVMQSEICGGPSRLGYTLDMPDEPYVNPFQKVHQAVQAAKDRAREVKESDAEQRKIRAKEEAVREGFDRT